MAELWIFDEQNWDYIMHFIACAHWAVINMIFCCWAMINVIFYCWAHCYKWISTIHDVSSLLQASTISWDTFVQGIHTLIEYKVTYRTTCIWSDVIVSLRVYIMIKAFNQPLLLMCHRCSLYTCLCVIIGELQHLICEFKAIKYI